ncbi:hypothetical protein OG609_44215 [Streptomyces sp. NBC_01224]|uniref:hypothetical protein n=1 Tax=unclassified Streptomyces TaxID=2593676 RepID=UPI002E157F4C|nr:hypothetical protein OG609_44215 [Streptomyces sp. NBC_01224]
MWLAGHAEQVAEAGPEAAGALLRLAARPGIGLNTQVRTMVNALTREGREPGAADGWLLRLAADWARDIPLADRDEDWIRTVEMLLAAVVHAEHDTDQEIRAAAEAGVPDAEPTSRSAWHGCPPAGGQPMKPPCCSSPCCAPPTPHPTTPGKGRRICCCR